MNHFYSEMILPKSGGKTMTEEKAQPDEQPEKHLEGEGHAPHRFNPERAQEFRDPDRLESLRLNELASKLELNPGNQLLDLGTGSGAILPYFSDYLLDGAVIGSDVNEEMLDMAREYVRENELDNVVLLKNEPDRLPNVDRTQDAVLILSSLHEFSDPETMLREVERVLKPGGVLAIIEWRYEETDEGPPLDHRLDPERIENWCETIELRDFETVRWTDGGYDLYRSWKTE
jgi:SAM-dependent methyltransferase